MSVETALLLAGDVINYRHDDYNGTRVGTVTAVRTSHRGWAEIDLTDNETGEPYTVKSHPERLVTFAEVAA